MASGTAARPLMSCLLVRNPGLRVYLALHTSQPSNMEVETPIWLTLGPVSLTLQRGSCLQCLRELFEGQLCTTRGCGGIPASNKMGEQTGKIKEMTLWVCVWRGHKAPKPNPRVYSLSCVHLVQVGAGPVSCHQKCMRRQNFSHPGLLSSQGSSGIIIKKKKKKA